ncbi:MAG: hypothetical protein ACXVLT_00455 [Flavisolibacter sp.]
MDKQFMNQEGEQQEPSQTGKGQSNDSHDDRNHPSPFKDTAAGADEAETNTQEEANLEQERKEAMTERD